MEQKFIKLKTISGEVYINPYMISSIHRPSDSEYVTIYVMGTDKVIKPNEPVSEIMSLIKDANSIKLKF
jgi:uncharacterized FlaG/YvyC family protein